jgi:phosphoglycerate dehydrogenase-like enzyme
MEVLQKTAKHLRKAGDPARDFSQVPLQYQTRHIYSVVLVPRERNKREAETVLAHVIAQMHGNGAEQPSTQREWSFDLKRKAPKSK